MVPIHISIASDLRHVLEQAKQPGEILVFPDDLSFGPISGDIAKARAAVKTDFADMTKKGDRIQAFWRRLDQDDGPLIVWFGRHSALEMAMLLALCDRLGERELSVIDVTNLSIRAAWNGATALIPPPQGIRSVPFSVLHRLLGKQVSLEQAARRAYAAQWRALQQENAPFRVLGALGLRSASADEFDSCLIDVLSNDWCRAAWALGAAEDLACRQYRQVGQFALQERAEALVNQGVLQLKGDFSNIWQNECALRLPNACPRPADKAEVVHVASNMSFAGSLGQQLRRAGKRDEVRGFTDDLTAGPIASDDVQVRTEWWNTMVDWPEIGEAISWFWDEAATGLPLVVWFGRNDSRDICFYMALCERFPDRIAAIGDVSTISVQYEWLDGTTIDIPSPQDLNSVPGNVLSALTDFTRRADPAEIAAHALRWRELKAENAPIRVMIDGEVVSQPETYFDNMLIKAAETSWLWTIRIIGDVMSRCYGKSCVSEFVLASRIDALVERGTLEAEGNPLDMRESRVKLAQAN
jgi:hypothetical protein